MKCSSFTFTFIRIIYSRGKWREHVTPLHLSWSAIACSGFKIRWVRRLPRALNIYYPLWTDKQGQNVFILITIAIWLIIKILMYSMKSRGILCPTNMFFHIFLSLAEAYAQISSRHFHNFADTCAFHLALRQEFPVRENK